MVSERPSSVSISRTSSNIPSTNRPVWDRNLRRWRSSSSSVGRFRRKYNTVPTAMVANRVSPAAASHAFLLRVIGKRSNLRSQSKDTAGVKPSYHWQKGQYGSRVTALLAQGEG